MSINLLEELRLKKVLGCGTIQKDRTWFPKQMEEDSSKKQVTITIVFQTRIWRVFKETTVKRTQKNGSRLDIKCPFIVADYDKYMGGVDRADQLRGT